MHICEKVSVGNIVVPKKNPADPLAAERKRLREAGFSEEDINMVLSGGGLPMAKKARRMLKASKRNGKRRSKKQLLQDLLH